MKIILEEKYRPQTIEDCILPEGIKDAFRGFLKHGTFSHLLLSGVSGVGKTTAAMALANELGFETLLINGSEESGIDTLRTKIKQFASSVSFESTIKVVILDEADHLNKQSFQPALRRFMDEFANNCRFIFTCNYKNRIIPALHSRTTTIEFRTPREEKPKIAAAFFARVEDILKKENIPYDREVVVKIVSQNFPDFRRTLNELELAFFRDGEVGVGALAQQKDEQIKQLIVALREQNFAKMRKWVANNIDVDVPTLLMSIYEHLAPLIKETGIPVLVVTLNEYQFKAAFVAEQELNLVACLTEVMATVTFKDA